MARDLGRLIAGKDNVHFDATMISMTDADAAVAEAKRMVGIVDEVRPVLRPGVAYDPGAALDRVEVTYIRLLG